MKVNFLTLVLTFFTSGALADADPKYRDPGVILADLKASLAVCESMTDGQVNVEIFGITFSRHGNVCRYGNGELDDLMRDYIEAQSLDWVGVEGQHGLWVKVSE